MAGGPESEGVSDMKERPIIMCASNVLALLRDHKSVTRRVMKPQPQGPCLGEVAAAGTEDGAGAFAFDGENGWVYPPCQPGDLYWVKETWCEHAHLDYPFGWGSTLCAHYRADGESCRAEGDKIKWKSPIFMPRRLSRITLRVKSVRPEQLGDMTANEARKEGVSTLREFHWLWETIHGKKAWNPDLWVWRIEFGKVKV